MNSRRPSILIVNDSPEEVAVYKRHLTRGSGQRYRVQQVGTGAKALTTLRRGAPDCVLLDFKLPDADAIEMLQAMISQSGQSGRSRRPPCAVIVLTEVGEEHSAAFAEEMMKFGAHDCLEKSWITPALLRRAIANAIEKDALQREVEERRRDSKGQAEAPGFNFSDVVIYQMRFDPDGTRRFLYISDNVERLKGVRVEDALADVGALYNLIPEDYRARMREVEEAALRDMTSFRFETPFVLPNGETRWSRISVSPRRLSDGSIVWDGVEIDITEGKRAEKALRESEEKFSKVFKASPHRITITTLDEGRYIDVNDAVLKSTGYKREEMVGHTAEEIGIFAEQDGQEKLIRALQSRPVRDLEFQLRSKNGEIKTVLMSAELITLNGRRCIVTLSNDITERKRAEEALRMSEERFRALADAIPSIVWMADPGGVITFHNQRWFDYSGVLPDADGEWLRLAIHPDDLERCLAEWERATETGREFEVELRARRRDGEYRWLLVRATPTRDAEGRVINWFGVATDIHDRKQAEQALRESQERLSLAMEAAGMFAWETDVATGRVNSNFPEAMMGMEPGSFGGTFDSFLSLVHPDDRESFLKVRKRALDGEAPYDLELRTVRLDGGVRWGLVRGVVHRDERGRPTRIVGVDVDITKRKQTEEKLREQERFIQSLIDAVPLGIYIFDMKEMRAVFTNSQLASMLGYAAGDLEALGAEILPLIIHHEDQRLIYEHLEALKNAPDNHVLEIECRVRDHDGQWRWLASRNLVFTRAADGTPQQILGVTQDVTKRKRAEEALRESAEHLRLAMEAANAGSFDWDIAASSVVWSPSHYRILGLEAQDGSQPQKLWRDHVHPEDQWVVSDIAEALVERRDLNVVYRVIRADGVVRWVNSVGHTFYNEAGEPERMLGLMIDISERKQAEEKLRESEERLRQQNGELENIYQAAPVGLSLIDRDFRFVRINETMAEINGISINETLGRTVREVMPEVADQIGPILKRVIRTGRPIMNLEMRGVTAREPKVERDWLVSYYPIKAADGGVQGIGSVAMEITDRKRAEEALRESEERLRLAAQAAGFGLYSIDLQSGEAYWSPEMRRMFGLSEGDVVAIDKLLEFVYPDDRDEVIRVVKASLDLYGNGEFEIEFRSFGLDGSVRWVLAKGKTLFAGKGRRRKAARVIGVAFDITERKRAEEALRDSERRLKLALTAGRAGMWEWQIKDDKLIWSDEYYEVLGMKPGDREPTLENFLLCVHPEDRDRMLAEMSEVLQERKDAEHEFRFVRHNGEARWALSKAHLTLDERGEPERLIGILFDITERKQAEMRIEESLRKEREARAQAQAANRGKDEFIAMVSHELRSPLNAMLGWSKILKKGGVDEKTQTHAVEVIERSARAQQTLIEDLLDMARIASGKLRLETRAVDLARLIENAADVVRPAAAAKEINLRLSINSADEVTGDADRLQQVIWNLLSNAVKFTPHGGSVEVTLERVGVLSQITVTDTGRGIKAEDLPFIFDRFRQVESANSRRFAGLGLGLALVKHLVELHGGTVQADSPGEGHGASFIIKLPVRAIRGETAPGRAGEWESERVRERGNRRRGEVESKVDVRHSPALPLSRSSALPLNGVWALIVDDEPDARELVATLLKQYGARVTDASCASEAFDKLRQGADGARPDVIISDISMPDEDGYMLIERIRGLPPEEGGAIPAIALTAFERPSDRIKALASGFSMHVPKPVEPEELAMVIANLTGALGRGMNVR